MKERSGELRVWACILGLVLVLSGSALAQNAPTAAPARPPAAAVSKPAPPAVSSQAVCLECHGPFDKLIAATANYAMPSGETTSPHRYVPHKSKKIPECSNCHQAHPVSPPSKEGMPKPQTDWCYKCHHAGVLECGTCH